MGETNFSGLKSESEEMKAGKKKKEMKAEHKRSAVHLSAKCLVSDFLHVC